MSIKNLILLDRNDLICYILKDKLQQKGSYDKNNKIEKEYLETTQSNVGS